MLLLEGRFWGKFKCLHCGKKAKVQRRIECRGKIVRTYCWSCFKHSMVRAIAI